MPLDTSIAPSLEAVVPQPRKRADLDAILESEGAGHLKDVVSAIYGQESGSGANPSTSVDGARGPMQVIPATFNRLARAGERVDNPDDNMRVGVRYIKQLADKFNNDPGRIAAGYFSGEGNVNPQGDTPYKADRADGNGKRVSSYVSDVLGRIVPSAQAAPAPAPKGYLPWSDVEAKPEYQALSSEEKDAARRQYFTDNIVPQLKTDQIAGAWSEFNQAPAKPGILATVADGAVAVGERMLDPFKRDRLPNSVMNGEQLAQPRSTEETGGVPLQAERLQQFRSIARDQPTLANKIAQKDDWSGQAMRAVLAEQGIQIERIKAGDNMISPNKQDIEYRATAAPIPELTAGGEDNAKIAYNQKGDIGKNAAHVTQGVSQGILDLRDGVIGAGQFALRLAGADDVADVLQKHQEDLKARGTNLDLPANANYGAKTVQSVVRSITTNVPGLLTGAEAPALTAMGLQSFGQEYGAGRQAGMTDSEAVVRAGIYAAAEVLGEKFGLADTLKGLKAAGKGVPTSELVNHFGRALAKEIPGEQLTSALEFAADKYLPQGLNPKATFDDYLRVVADTTVQTLLQGGLMMGGGAGINAAVKAIDRRFPGATLGRAMREAVEGGQFNQDSIDRSARLGMDPNNDANTVVAPEARAFAPEMRPAPVQTAPGNDPLADAPITSPIAGDLAGLEQPAPATEDPAIGGTPASQHTLASLQFLMNTHPDQFVREQAASAAQQKVAESQHVDPALEAVVRANTGDDTATVVPESALPPAGSPGRTGTSRENAEVVRAILDVSGKEPVWYIGQPGSAEGFVRPVSQANRVFLNAQAVGTSPMAVAGHEVFHHIEQEADLAAAFRGVVDRVSNINMATPEGILAYARTYAPNVFSEEAIAAKEAEGKTAEQIVNELAPQIGEGYTPARISREFYNDLFGNRWSEPSFYRALIKELARTDVGLLHKFKTALDLVANKVRSIAGHNFEADKFLSDLEPVRQEAARVYAAYASRQSHRTKIGGMTPAELLLTKKSHPDDIVRDMAEAELKRREVEHAYKQNEPVAAARAKETAKQERRDAYQAREAKADAAVEQAMAETKAAGTDETPTALQAALATAKKDNQSLRRQLATEMKKAAATARGQAQVRADQLEDNESGQFSPARTIAGDIKQGETLEQSEPLSPKQWKDVREIALAALSPKAKAKAVEAERDYLARTEEANRDSEAYKEIAQRQLAAMSVPVLSTVPVMQGKKKYTIAGTGKNNKTRVFDVARVLRKGVLSKVGDITTAEGRERVARAMVHEALYSLSMDGHAIGWYDRKVREALAVTALAHPEILTDGASNFHFRVIAAVTSNGQAVRDNFILANDIYKIWKSEGILPTEFEGGGTRAPAMKVAFAKLNQLVKDRGWEATEAELMAMRTVREIEQQFGLKINGELKDALVPTAVGMGGPKIGNFFANLSGYFDSPTMDLWFMRTIGRMTGGLIQTKKGLIGHLDKMLTLLPEKGAVHGIQVSAIRKEVEAYKALPEDERLDPEVTIKVLKNTEAYGRAQYARFAAEDENGKTFTQKTPENENARSLKSNLSALVEAPSSGTERAFLRHVVQRSLALLERAGVKLSAADLQAVLWYYEKNLYAKLGDISESAKPWDYASAARFGVGRELGLVDVGSSSRARQVRGGQLGSTEDVAGGVLSPVLGTRGQEVTQQSPARVLFEVAPDPNDVKLTAAWNTLSSEDKLAVSEVVAGEIIPKILAKFNATGYMTPQVGGYLGASNPSFAINLTSGNPDAVAKGTGFVLSQDMMIAVSDQPFAGGFETGALTIEIGAADPAAVYSKIFEKVKEAEGHTTVDGQMIIINNPDLGLTTEELGHKVDAALGSAYDVHVDNGVYASFPTAENYGYASGSQEQSASEAPDQGWAGQLRTEANEALGRELAARFGSDAASDGRGGAVAPRDGQEVRGYGTAAPGAVSVQGIHYSAGERSNLDGRYYGTGTRGAEGPRVRAAQDSRLKERIYFYVNSGKGIRPEQGVGSLAHTAQLNNVYDANADTWIQAKVSRGLSGDAWMNAFESAVLDNGFDGYVTDFGIQRAAVLLGRHNVPVSRSNEAGETQFSPRRKPDPVKTVTAYKLFRVDRRRPGELFPLFVQMGDNGSIPIGSWQDAEEGEAAANGKVKSKLGLLAYRPGWHAGDLPIATHIGEGGTPPKFRPANQVWAEVEMAADVDWQAEATKRGTNATGKVVPVKAHITDKIPVDGFYRYKTNANMTGNWLIGGSMKINRLLSDAEVESINKAAGTADLPRQAPFDAEKYGFSPARAISPAAQKEIDRMEASVAKAPSAMVSANIDRVKRALAGEIVKDEQGNLIAPNGRKSNLTEAQYRQTRSPEFMAWFGDWLSFHNAKNGDGVWSADGVSKVVDKNGEPQVVYHGTEKGGFTTMRPEKADAHRKPMVFAAATRETARSYSRMGDEIDLSIPEFEGAEARKIGKDWFVVNKGGDGSMAYNVYGEYVDQLDAEGYASKKEAEYFRDTELEQVFRDNAVVQRGVYSLFLNIRNPNEQDFEGANWDGTAPFDKYEVVKDEENVYGPNGEKFMDYSDAEALAEENDAEVVKARDNYFKTDDIANEAIRFGHDGAIIRSVQDDGGRGGYVESDDVFIFFNSNQAKSATQNTGAFSKTNDDLRFSPARWREVRAAWLQIAEESTAFQLPKSSAETLAGVMKDLDPGIVVTQKGVFGDMANKGIKERYVVRLPGGKDAEVYVKANGRMWVNASQLKAGTGGGVKLYQGLLNFAHNTGKVLVGDPLGVSDLATFRRTEQMLSAALKFGTTDFMEPSNTQASPKLFKDSLGHHNGVIEQFADLKWEKGNDPANLASLLNVSYTNIHTLVPEIDHVQYNFERDAFEHTGTARVVTNAEWQVLANQLAAALRGRRAAGGDRSGLPVELASGDNRSTTLQRAALTGTLLRGEGRDGGRPVLAAGLGKLRELRPGRGGHPVSGDSAGSVERDSDQSAGPERTGTPLEGILYSPPRFYSQLGRAVEQAPDRVFSTARTAAVQWMYQNRELPRVPGQALIDEADARFDKLVAAFLNEPMSDALLRASLPATPMPSVLHMLGLPNQWVAYHGSIIDKVLSSKHAADFDGLTPAEMNQLLRSPMFVAKLENGDVEVYTDHVRDGKVLMFALAPNKAETAGLRPGQKLNTTQVKSAYARPWLDYSFEGKMRPGVQSTLFGPMPKVKVVYADHLKFGQKERDLTLRQPRSSNRGVLPASPAKVRVEKGLLNKSLRGYGDLVNFIKDKHQGVPQDVPMFSPNRIIQRVDAAVDGLSNLPGQFDYLKDRYLALGKIARVDEIIKEIRGAFDKLPQADKAAVYGYLTTRGAPLSMIGPTEAQAMAKRVKDTINYVGDALVARGLLDPAARAHYKDQYLPRLYLKHLMSEADWKVLGAGKKPTDMGYLKARKDIPAEVRELVLGEVKDPSFLAASAIGRAMRDVALLDWMGKISQNNDWVYPGVFVTYKGQRVTSYWLKAEADRIERQIPHYAPANQAKAKQLVADMRQAASTANLDHLDHTAYKQVPDTLRYGMLRGMWLRKEIYNDIMGASQIVNADPTWFENWFGFGGSGTKLTQWWKFSKVALNPPGQVRNFLSNMVMLQLSGVGLHKLPFRVLQAAREIVKDGPHWKVAKKYGVTESTFTAQELFRVKRDLLALENKVSGANPLTWIRLAGAHFLDSVGNLYQFSEALGKVVKIIDEMEKGKNEAEAAIEAQKWLFDYSLVPQSVRIARNSPIGLPFITYQIKVLPRLLEVAMTAPWRLLPWVGLLYGMQAYVASLFGVDEDELKKLKKSLPQWLQDRGHTVFMPTRDADGRLQVADVGYFFPWSFYSQTAKHAAEGNLKKVLVEDIGGQFSAPIIGAAAALMANYDSFTKRPIYNESDPVAYQAAAIANYSYDLMAPPFLSSHGFASPMGLVDKQYGGKMVQAVTGTTNKFGDPKATEAQALAGLLGFNFYGMDPEHTRVTNIQVMTRKVIEAENSLKAKLMDRSLTDEQRAKVVGDYKERMIQLGAEAKKYAEESEVPEQLKVKPR